MSARKMSGVGLAVLFAAAMIASLAGCPSRPQGGTPAVTPPVAPPPLPSAVASGEIMVVGSNTILPIAQKWQQAYNQKHPEVKIAVAGGGSGTGIKSLIGKSCTIANSSRKIKPEEIEQAKAAGVNPVEHLIGYDGIAVIVNKQNPLTEISVQTLSDIYVGKITKWDEVGARGLGEIQVVSRDSSSGTYESFKEMVITLGGKDKSRDYLPNTLHQSNEAIMQTIATTKNAISYIGLGFVNDTVKVLAVVPLGGGKAVLPSEATVRDNSYPLARELYVYTDGEPTGALKDYLDWCLGPEGQALVKEVGYIPLAAAKTPS